MDEAELRRRASELSWYHSIDLGQGVVTAGMSKNRLIDDQIPDVTGREVLDIGAWDGYYSFLAERRGAKRVVALDHYVWCLDFGARQAYWDECARNGTFPDHDRDERDFWQPDEMPGRRAFDFAREALDSKVEPVVADFMKVDLDELGTFDVVVYLGVLYHMREPYTALERLRKVTREVAVIETEAFEIPGRESEPVLRFYAGNEMGEDFGNWFAISEPALQGMCRAAGFSRVETKIGPPDLGPAPEAPHWYTRNHAKAVTDYEATMAERAKVRHYRIVLHAFV